jgi:hypothetical protein
MAFLGIRCLIGSTSEEMPKPFREFFKGRRVCDGNLFERSSRDMKRRNRPDDLLRKPNLPPKPGLTGLKSIKRFGWREKGGGYGE